MTNECLQMARDYYISCGCSHFHMSREDPDYYTRYCALGIPRHVEQEWLSTCFDAAYSKVSSETHKARIPMQFAELMELLMEYYNTPPIDRVITLLKDLRIPTGADNDMLIAEEIIGRNEPEYRNSFLFKCTKQQAEHLLCLAVDIAQRELQSSNDNRKHRATIALQRAIRTAEVLGLKSPK